MDGQAVSRAQVRQSVIELLEGDIAQQTTDAIVNAANSSLLGGGGVDGAIHRAAGPELLAETRALGGCATGDAKISRGYLLPARHVIHAVGPIYRSGDSQVAALLASAYRRSLEVAAANGIETVSFPSISTGAYGYPVEEAAPIALRTAADFLGQNQSIRLLRFVLFNAAILAVYNRALDALVASRYAGLQRPAGSG
ncbi:MAG: O-acetyl-ADP-ribose deacetylase [Anaerolineae bacterium]|nr:O-acetyl-ADP-ribose deacetylase [Anaerolineae bacterium]